MPLAPIVQDDLFNIDRFQVPRSEGFAHLCKATLIISSRSFFCSSACLRYFSGLEYILPLVDKNDKEIAIRASDEDARDSQKWCVTKDGKRYPRNITAPGFIAKILRMMNWNPEYRYKIVGQCIRDKGNVLQLVFDLMSALPYKRVLPDGKNPHIKRPMWVPVETDNGFGLPFAEHRKRYQAKRFDKFARARTEDASDLELPLS